MNATLQVDLGEKHFHGNYGLALALTVSVILVAVALITALGREARGIAFEAAA